MLFPDTEFKVTKTYVRLTFTQIRTVVRMMLSDPHDKLPPIITPIRLIVKLDGLKDGVLKVVKNV